MFDSIGEKIKTLAMAITTIGIILSIVSGLVWTANDRVVTGIIVAATGSFASWISSFFCCGFGELITETTKIRKMLQNQSYYNED